MSGDLNGIFNAFKGVKVADNFPRVSKNISIIFQNNKIPLKNSFNGRLSAMII